MAELERLWTEIPGPMRASILTMAGAAAQVLARHSTPGITMNTYARTRMERLHELVETTEHLFVGG